MRRDIVQSMGEGVKKTQNTLLGNFCQWGDHYCQARVPGSHILNGQTSQRETQIS